MEGVDSGGGDPGSMKRDEMVLNGTSLCARGMVVLRSRRDAGWMDGFFLGGRSEERIKE